jgi:hypothetical protein
LGAAAAAPHKGKIMIMAGERELTTGLLAKDASFRLIVTGNVGVKEIERLIKKLELDKEILADQDDAPLDDDIADDNQRDKRKRPPTEAAFTVPRSQRSHGQ